MTPEARNWLMRWKLKDGSSCVPWEMFVSMPEEAFDYLPRPPEDVLDYLPDLSCVETTLEDKDIHMRITRFGRGGKYEINRFVMEGHPHIKNPFKTNTVSTFAAAILHALRLAAEPVEDIFDHVIHAGVPDRIASGVRWLHTTCPICKGSGEAHGGTCFECSGAGSFMQPRAGMKL